MKFNEYELELMRKVANYMKMEFNKFQARAIGRGERLPSQADFAKFLGWSPTILSYIVNEQRLPTIEQVDLAATKLGPDLYDITGIAPRLPSDRYLKLVARRWHMLNDTQKRQVWEEVDNWTFEDKPKRKGSDDKRPVTEPQGG